VKIQGTWLIEEKASQAQRTAKCKVLKVGRMLVFRNVRLTHVGVEN
jgi:hypothetical protein